jgi:hypothetical protein
MTPISRSIAGAVLIVAALTSPLATQPGSGAGPRFFPDDPLQVEVDHQDASKTHPWQIDLTGEIINSLFGKPGDPALNVRAQNVNTIDEVPDSSWFTNRLGRKALTAAEVGKGPDTTTGPAKGTWTITSSKSDGITPGFTIRDAANQVWFLKFDPPGYRGMATGTEVLVTKLLWAAGYHVPESYIAFLRPEQVVVGNTAKFTPFGGKPRPMRTGDLADLLKRADREGDGSYRVIAGKALPKIGEFRFFGTHPDDPNDIVPHEHRRELRGMRVFAAWVNHVDVKGKNTLDALIKEDGRSFIRHYLQDFGSALGSASVGPHEPWEGSEYLAEPRTALKEVIGFGFRFPSWQGYHFFESRSVGRMLEDNSKFDPEEWKPRVPNPAFDRARADDKFWAAVKLAAFSDDLVRAAVQSAAFEDAKSEEFLFKALGDRRDAIARAYIPTVNPVSSPAIESNVLTFENVAVTLNLAKPPARYRVAWFTFDNATGDSRPITETTQAGTRVTLPTGLPTAAGAFIRIEVSATGGHPSWEKPVSAFFQRQNDGWKLIGFERLPDSPS